MQRWYLKNISIVTIIFFSTFSTVLAQTSSYRLKTADSLFAAKRYTQSLEHYESILKQKQYTPAMLLKMAFMQEGLHHVGQAMYYLNLYYLASNDRTVLEKMEDLASKHNLGGYETSDTDRFLTYYRDHVNYISAALGALSVFFVSIMFYTRYREKRKPVFSSIALAILLLTLGYHINLGGRSYTGIITCPHTYLMHGPSAGASVREILQDGNRVKVMGQTDVWIKIKWNSEEGYIRQNCLLPVEL